MSVLLLRVDERLIHGQVTLGWGGHLHPECYTVVDDPLAGSEWEQDIYALGVPSEARAEFVRVSEGREGLAGWIADGTRRVVLTRNVEAMAGLLVGWGREASGEGDGPLADQGDRRARPLEVNLGGIYHREGREALLPYLFLDEKDRAYLRVILATGIGVVAQDIPASPAQRVEALLDR